MKKLSFLFICLVVMVVVGSTPIYGQEKPITLTVWSYDTTWKGGYSGFETDEQGKPIPSTAYLDAVVQEFIRLHPNVNFAMDLMGIKVMNEKVPLAFKTGNTPDLLWFYPDLTVRYASEGLVVPVPLTAKEREDFFEAGLDLWTYKGQLYSIPVTLGCFHGMHVNVDLFKERGTLNLLPLNRDERSWTFEEFVKAAEKMTYDVDGDGTPDVYGISICNGMGDHFIVRELVWLWSSGAKNFANKERTELGLNSPEGVYGLQFLLDLINRYKVAVPGAAGINFFEATRMFNDQKVAMHHSGLWELTTERPFEMATVQPPHRDGYEAVVAAHSAGWIVPKSKDSYQMEMAIEFVKFFSLSPRTLRRTILLEGLPGAKSAMNVPWEDSRYEASFGEGYLANLRVFVNLLPNATDFMICPLGAKLLDKTRAEYQAALVGAKTPKEALDDLAAEMNPLLR